MPDTEIADWWEMNLRLGQDKILYSYDPEVFFQERWATHDFSYQLPLRESGPYVVISQHTEMAFQASGKRAFSIFFGTCAAKERIDAFALSGGRGKAANVYVPFEFNNGEVTVEGRVCRGALSGDGRSLIVTFKHINVDNPMVNALVLFQGKLEETDYPRLKEIRQEFDDIYDEERKKADFEKYNMQNRYAKLKKRRRNFYIDRSHHYSIIYDDDDVGSSGSGYIKLVLLVAFLTAVVWFVAQAKNYVKGNKLEFTESEKTEDQNRKQAAAAKRKSGANKKNQ